MRAERGRAGIREGWGRLRRPTADAGSRDAAKALTGAAAIYALIVANVRFWPTVAPVVRVELAHWRAAASRIADEGLREMALAKLTDEAFNAEVAATLATIAPRAQRAAAVRAIVALEVLFDYLDGRTEALLAPGPGDADGEDRDDSTGGGGEVLPVGAASSPASERERADADAMLEEGRMLSESLRAVIDGHAPSVTGADGDYLDALWRYAHERFRSLPSHQAIKPAALAAASRCAEAQLQLHAAAAHGDEQLQGWAREACAGSGLDWREYLGGGASSVLAMHALIATAARANVAETDACALDAAYLAIGAVITTLDSLVDDARDQRAGEPGYIRLYSGREEIEARLIALIAQALTRAGQLQQGAHHTMTLAGVAAYYTTHPGAADAENRGIRRAVRRELTPAIWPTLAVLATWRAAKRARGVLRGPTPRASANTRPANGEQSGRRG